MFFSCGLLYFQEINFCPILLLVNLGISVEIANMLETPKRIAVRKKKNVLKTVGVSFSIPKSRAKATPFMPSKYQLLYLLNLLEIIYAQELILQIQFFH